MEMKKSSLGMEANIAAGLSYVLGLITGLIFFLAERENEFVKFHAAQSILLTISILISDILVFLVSSVFAAIPFIGWGVSLLLTFIVSPLLNIMFFVLWIVCMIQAFQGKWFEIPIVAPYAKKMAGLEGGG